MYVNYLIFFEAEQNTVWPEIGWENILADGFSELFHSNQDFLFFLSPRHFFLFQLILTSHIFLFYWQILLLLLSDFLLVISLIFLFFGEALFAVLAASEYLYSSSVTTIARVFKIR